MNCSELLKSVFDDFGYRLNALSAETFFSDGVFLVEGTSEVLFYTALARELKLDLDRHNISILSVEGVGFKPYVAICNALNISWVLRTDNDIFSKTSVTPVKKYYAGISRGIGIVKDIGDNKVFIKLVESGLTGIAVGDINQAIYGFTKRFPKYLIALMKRDDFARFELSKNHRCHPSIIL